MINSAESTGSHDSARSARNAEHDDFRHCASGVGAAAHANCDLPLRRGIASVLAASMAEQYPFSAALPTARTLADTVALFNAPGGGRWHVRGLVLLRGAR